MGKRSKKRQQPDASHEEAKQIARSTQRPGQTKEQTKLVAQGIKKGIDQYKKQQSAKARELDKKLKKARQQPSADVQGVEIHEKVTCRQHWLPWALLIISWLAMAACLVIY